MTCSSEAGTLAFSSIGGRGSRLQNGVEDDRRRRTLERPLTGRHLVQDDAEREKIGARVELLTSRLLG